MKNKKQNNDINYLDLIPERNEALGWHKDLKERVILEVENTGIMNTIAQKVFNKPRFTKVHLDRQGSFIWPLIDGKRTVADIAALVKEEFGEAAEPLYPRIVKILPDCRELSFCEICKHAEKIGQNKNGKRPSGRRPFFSSFWKNFSMAKQ